MSTKYAQSNDKFFIRNANDLVVHATLPANVYVLKFNQQEGLYLQEADSFDLPTKFYGSVQRDSDRILNTFADRKQSTGVLLTGERGSGKTMLAKKVAVDALAKNVPVILVNDAFSGTLLNSFVQNIQQDAMFLFDEFEKTHTDQDQQAILTLLDGTIKTKKLFIFTSNSKWKLNEHMQNRPGRIFYMKEYNGIDIKFIEEYANDNLKESLRHHVPSLMRYSLMFTVFNFDMLKAVVEEMNRYDESVAEAISMLNANPQFSGGNRDYVVTVHTADGTHINDFEWHGNPFMSNDDSQEIFNFYCYGFNGRFHTQAHKLLPPLLAEAWDRGERTEMAREMMDEIEHVELSFAPRDMIELNPDGTMKFRDGEGNTASLKRKEYRSFNAVAYA